MTVLSDDSLYSGGLLWVGNFLESNQGWLGSIKAYLFGLRCDETGARDLAKEPVPFYIC